MYKTRDYNGIHNIIYFIMQISLYIYSILQFGELNTLQVHIFVYSFPFLFFYEGLYFHDKEYNYAQIAKLILITSLFKISDISLYYTFTVFTWLHSVFKNLLPLQRSYSNNKNERLKCLKKITVYYFINSITCFLSIILIFRSRLIESIILFGFSFFYIFIFYCKSITYSPYFNITNIEPNYFIPTSRLKFNVIENFASIQLHEFMWIIPILGGILYLLNNSITTVVMLCLLLVYICQISKNGISVYGKRFLTFFFQLLIHLFLIILLIYIITNHTTVNKETMNNISTMIVSVIAADLIFNFTAMFILSQENYNKFNSVYILRNIITKWTVFLSVVIPAILIVILILDKIPEKYFILYSVCCIIYCIFCSIRLLWRLKKSLNTIELILGLISNTNSQIIQLYCNGNFETDDNDIDTILKILVDTINRKEYTLSQSIFEIVLHWMEKYRKDISITDYSPYFESQNKFYKKFINILVATIVDSKSQEVIRQFSDEIWNILKFANLEVEYREYHVFYNAINKMISKLLQIENYDFENSAKHIFNICFIKAGYILSNTTESIRKENFFIDESDSYREFKSYYFSPIEQVIRNAAKQNKIDFLRGIDLFTSFFQFVPNDIGLNENHLQIVLKITHIYSSILSTNNYNEELLASIFSDYKSLLHYISYLRIPKKLNVLINNVVFNSIRDIYNQLINNRFIFDEKDFRILYEYYFDRNGYKINSIDYLSLFCNVVSSYFDYSKNNLDKNKQNRIWSRIIQLQRIFHEKNEFELSEYINMMICKISEKNPQLEIDYKQYEEDWNHAISSWKKYQNDFNMKYN